jgi:hypothetical protein
VPIRVENTVAAQPKRLMNLEIKADRSHTLSLLPRHVLPSRGSGLNARNFPVKNCPGEPPPGNE